MENFPKIIVIHVSNGYEDRARHIEANMKKLGLEFTYMLRGDISDLTDEVLEKYFTPEFRSPDGVHSCSYKHLLAYQEIIAKKLEGAIIVEDDAVLFRNFESIVRRALAEFSELPPRPAIISFEDTRLRFIPRSQRTAGRVLYPGDRDRFTGCYYINRLGAEKIVEYASTHQFDRPIDNFHCLMLKRGLLDYYWTQPTAATQGSFTGLFPSSLTKRYGKIITPFVWQFKLHYHKMLFWFR